MKSKNLDKKKSKIYFNYNIQLKISFQYLQQQKLSIKSNVKSEWF